MRLIFILIFSFPLFIFGQGYQADSIKVTETVRQFVKKYKICGSDKEIVHKIIEITHDNFLFIKIDRQELKKWIRNPALFRDYKEEVELKKRCLKQLNQNRLKRVLTDDEYKERKALLKEIFFEEHNIKVYENLIQNKNMLAQDMAFVVSGSEAIKHHIRDGCTTMAHLFIALAKAAGLEDIRFVVGANVREFKKACPALGKPRKENVEIDGHMMALVNIDGKWALVNCTHLESYSKDENIRYEILYELDGEALSPEMIKGRVVNLPSYQRENFPPSELLIVGVGTDKNDDLDVENHRALMNLSVSGSPKDCICKWKISEKK
jgi:hypothetical protein